MNKRGWDETSIGNEFPVHERERLDEVKARIEVSRVDTTEIKDEPVSNQIKRVGKLVYKFSPVKKRVLFEHIESEDAAWVMVREQKIEPSDVQFERKDDKTLYCSEWDLEIIWENSDRIVCRHAEQVFEPTSRASSNVPQP